jgi:hypothetical protein
MRRREFIAGVGSAAAWPVAATGQQVAPQDGRVRHRRAGHRSDEVGSGRESPSRSFIFFALSTVRI